MSSEPKNSTLARQKIAASTGESFIADSSDCGSPCREKLLVAEANRLIAWNVARHLLQVALAGCMLAVALLGLAVVSPGGKQALAELKHHVLFGNPLLWAITLIIVCGVVVARGAKRLKVLTDWVLNPILTFVAHAYGVALGSIPIVAIAKWLGLVNASATGWSVMVLAAAMSLLVAAMALIGIEVSKDETLPVRLVTFWLAFGTFVFGLLAMFALMQVDKPSDRLLLDVVQSLGGHW